MARELVTTWYGAYVVEDGDIVEARPYPAEPEGIAERLDKVRGGGVLDEERDLAAARAPLRVRSRRLLSLNGTQMAGARRPVAALPAQPPDAKLLREATLLVARRAIREHLADRTAHLMQAIAHLDESHESENELGERLISWVTFHAPAAARATEDASALATRLTEDPDAVWAESSVADALGSPPSDIERRAIQELAGTIVALVAARAPLDSLIESTVREIAPNLTTLVGPRVGARLIHEAHGLERLARMPASTVQTLGAEKALFRHLTEGAPPPKHGVLFQHPLVNRSHPSDRGSIARALAGKAVIAARADAYTGRDLGTELKAHVEARAEQLKRVGRRKAEAARERRGRKRRGGGRR